jgi:hypothetical protein
MPTRDRLRPDDRDGTADIREKTIERDQDRTIQSIGPDPLWRHAAQNIDLMAE